MIIIMDMEINTTLKRMAYIIYFNANELLFIPMHDPPNLLPYENIYVYTLNTYGAHRSC